MNTFSMKRSYIIIGVIVVLVLWVWSSYNGLVKANLAVDTQWAQVETQYRRRVDLIPNLVASVQGSMKQEKAIFTAIADARTQYAGAKSVDQKAQAASALETGIGRLLVVMENYPVLTSTQTVQTLMAQLEGTENRVSVERNRFNDAVSMYNMKVKTFPGVLVAKLFGFAERVFFKADVGAAQAPKVNL
jgi:LemA protein